MLRFVFSVERTSEAAWKVTVTDPTAGQDPFATRVMVRWGNSGPVFPLPPTEEVDAIPAGAPHEALCRTPQNIEIVRIRLLARLPRTGEVEAFGRYLHTALIGDRVWAMIRQKARGRPFELALRWATSEWELTHLPWEMMRDGEGAPVARDVGITRLVANAQGRETLQARAPEAGGSEGIPFMVSPKVLFVVGSRIDDPRIRPAAEFLSVWHRLQAEDVLFDFRILQQPTSEQIEDAMGRFRPSVVHFICHGDVEGHEGFLSLESVSPEGKRITDRRTAERLADLLRTEDGLPPVVVVNACFSATQPGAGEAEGASTEPVAATVGLGGAAPGGPAGAVAGEVPVVSSPTVAAMTGMPPEPGGAEGPVATVALGRSERPVAAVPAPLAADLVRMGVPMVVGMAGRISDLACRLFARRFYQALLEEESIASATAEGRSAGIKHGADPQATIDWAMPSLFMADWVSPTVHIDGQQVKRLHLAKEVSARIRTLIAPRVFCGRIEVMEGYDDLIGRGDTPGKIRVLVIEEKDVEITIENSRFGKTRALEELAARAVRDGHFPIPVAFKSPDEERPGTALALAEKFRDAITGALHIRWPDENGERELRKLIRRFTGLDLQAALDPTVQREYEDRQRGSHPEADLNGNVLAKALQIELATITGEIRRLLASDEAQVLVLVDDLHKFDAAARVLVDELITADGLGRLGSPIPVVLAYSSNPQANAGYDAIIAALQQFVERNAKSPNFRHVSIERFRSPDDPTPFRDLDRDPLALIYQEFLLDHEPPLVFHRAASEESMKWFLSELHKRVLGVPSRLDGMGENRSVVDFIESVARFPSTPVLVEADDQRLLEKIRSGNL